MKRATADPCHLSSHIIILPGTKTNLQTNELQLTLICFLVGVRRTQNANSRYEDTQRETVTQLSRAKQIQLIMHNHHQQIRTTYTKSRHL